MTMQWHSLSREEQAKYYEKARQERQLHMQLYPGWSARDNYGYGTKKKKRKKERTPIESGGSNFCTKREYDVLEESVRVSQGIPRLRPMCIRAPWAEWVELAGRGFGIISAWPIPALVLGHYISIYLFFFAFTGSNTSESENSALLSHVFRHHPGA